MDRSRVEGWEWLKGEYEDGDKSIILCEEWMLCFQVSELSRLEDQFRRKIIQFNAATRRVLKVQYVECSVI